MSEKTGIFICSCSDNINKIIDYKKLKDFSSGLGDDIHVFEHKLLCSDQGKKFFKESISNNDLNRALIVGCSPKQHEITFRRAAEDTKLNPYLINIANIREQCAYVTEDNNEALEKAEKLVKGTYKRLLLQKPLEKNEITINPDAVVIGAGIAGMEAALQLAQKNRKVYLIEKNPNLGGMVTKQEELYPNMDCATCLLEPKMDEVLHNEHIDIHFLSEVIESKGFAGNFEVFIKKNPRYVNEQCLGCGECFKVCPVEIENEFNECLDKRKAIYIPYLGALPFIAAIDSKHCLRFNGKECDECQKVCTFGAIDYNEQSQEFRIEAGAIVIATGSNNFNKNEYMESRAAGVNSKKILSSAEFERITSQTGPTGGEIKLDDGKVPKSIAIIHCVGSRSTNYKEYCASICCMVALKYNKLIKHKLPESKVYHVYKDLVLSGKYDMDFFNSIIDKKNFIRTDNIDNLKFSMKGKKIHITGAGSDINADLVILMTPITAGESNEKLRELFDLSFDKYGFIKEEHNRINLSGTEIKGVHIAGTVQGPKDIGNSVLQAGSSAGQILSKLIPGEKLELEAITAVINEEKCSGCKICIPMCPYKAISFDNEKKVSIVEMALCQACGTCVSACPAGSIAARNFEDNQIAAELMEVV